MPRSRASRAPPGRWVSTSWLSFFSLAMKLRTQRSGGRVLRFSSCTQVFLGLFFRIGEQVAETAEAFLPHRPAMVDPLLHRIQPFGVNAAGAYPPDLFGAHQAAFFEDLKVLNDCGQCYFERLGQL